MRWLLKLKLAATLALLCLSCLVAVDSTAQMWSAPTNISNTAGSSEYPKVAIDSSGNPHAVWQDDPDKVLHSRWNGTSWSNPINISNRGGSAFPTIAIDSSGNPHVVWQDTINAATGNTDIFYSRWNGTNWSSSVNISNNTGTSASPIIAIDASGNIHVVWYDLTPGNFEISYSRWNGTSWSNPMNISNTAGNSVWPAIAIDASGNIHVVWGDSTLLTATPGSWEILYSRRLAGADAPSATASTSISQLTAIPTTVVADGISAATITITLKDANGNPLSGKNVTLYVNSTQDNVTQNSITQLAPTNASGQTTATFKSTTPVVKTITATVDTISIMEMAEVHQE